MCIFQLIAREAVAQLDDALEKTVAAEPALRKLRAAVQGGHPAPGDPEAHIDAGLAAGIITEPEAAGISAAIAARKVVIQVDEFLPEYLTRGAQRMGEQQSGWGGRPVYVVDGSRTPFIKARGKPGPFQASDLAIAAGQTPTRPSAVSAAELDEVILGCMMPESGRGQYRPCQWHCVWAAANACRHGRCSVIAPPACSPSILPHRILPADVPAWCWPAAWSP